MCEVGIAVGVEPGLHSGDVVQAAVVAKVLGYPVGCFRISGILGHSSDPTDRHQRTVDHRAVCRHGTRYTPHAHLTANDRQLWVIGLLGHARPLDDHRCVALEEGVLQLFVGVGQHIRRGVFQRLDHVFQGGNGLRGVDGGVHVFIEIHSTGTGEAVEVPEDAETSLSVESQTVEVTIQLFTGQFLTFRAGEELGYFQILIPRLRRSQLAPIFLFEGSSLFLVLEEVFAVLQHDHVAVNRQRVRLAAELAIQFPVGRQHVLRHGIPDGLRLLGHQIIKFKQEAIAGEIADVGRVEDDYVKRTTAYHELGHLFLVHSIKGNLSEFNVNASLGEVLFPELERLQVVTSIANYRNSDATEVFRVLPLVNIRRGFVGRHRCIGKSGNYYGEYQHQG